MHKFAKLMLIATGVCGIGIFASLQFVDYIGKKENAQTAESIAKQAEQPKLTQQQHLERLILALSRLKNSGKVVTSEDYANYDDAAESFGAITEPQLVKEKEKLTEQLATAKKRIDRDKLEMTIAAERGERINFAHELERSFLKEGRDVYVSVSGKDNEILNIRYVLVSRPFVHNLTNNRDFERMLRFAKFKKVVLTDGHNERWTIKPN